MMKVSSKPISRTIKTRRFVITVTATPKDKKGKEKMIQLDPIQGAINTLVLSKIV